MIVDKKFKELKVGDVCFYSEKYYKYGDNYSDSFMEIYEHEGVLKTGVIIMSDRNKNCYVYYDRDPRTDYDLEDHTILASGYKSNRAQSLTLIPGVKAEELTIYLANKIKPYKEHEYVKVYV